MYKKIALSLCFTLFLGMLNACVPNSLLHLKKTESNTEKTQKIFKNNAAISTPIALPPSFKDQPLKPGQTNTVFLPNGLPALSPMRGINANTLFSKKIKNTGDRFNRVENAVVDLRKEFDVYKPSIVRLAAVESDIQNLIKELEVLLQETPNQQQLPIDLMTRPDAQLQVSQLNPQPTPPYGKEIPTVIEAKPPPKATPPPDPPPQFKKVKPKKQLKPMPKYDGVIAKDLRAGEHADKLRIVIDTNKQTNFNIDLDNNEKLIIIELPDARWIGSKIRSFPHSKVLDSYSIEPLNNGKGSMIVLSLKKTTKIIQKKRLSPDDNSPYHRIYFDLGI